MTINAYTSIAQFTTVGAEDSSATYHTIAPSLAFDPAESVITDIGKFDNEVIKFHLRMDTITATNFKIMLGCDVSGAGRAIQFDFSADNKWIRLVNTSGIDQAYDSVISEVDIHNRWLFSDAGFIPCRVEISNNKLHFYYANMRVIETTIFTTIGNHFGFCNLTGSTLCYVSDIYHYTNQILYGNVNLNGAPDSRGIVNVYNQSTYELVSYTFTDTNGEYMVFLDDDPANANKYFLYGYIQGLGTVQPRGVSNITL